MLWSFFLIQLLSFIDRKTDQSNYLELIIQILGDYVLLSG